MLRWIQQNSEPSALVFWHCSRGENWNTHRGRPLVCRWAAHLPEAERVMASQPSMGQRFGSMPRQR